MSMRWYQGPEGEPEEQPKQEQAPEPQAAAVSRAYGPYEERRYQVSIRVVVAHPDYPRFLAAYGLEVTDYNMACVLETLNQNGVTYTVSPLPPPADDEGEEDDAEGED